MSDSNLPDGCTQEDIDRGFARGAFPKEDEEEVDVFENNSLEAEKIVEVIWHDVCNRIGITVLVKNDDDNTMQTWADKIDEILGRGKP